MNIIFKTLYLIHLNKWRFTRNRLPLHPWYEFVGNVIKIEVLCASSVHFKKMELPPELLQIVREFSKPVFAHWKIFNEAKSVFGSGHLKSLRKALLGPRNIQVCEALKTYLNNVRVLKMCELNPICVWRRNGRNSNEDVRQEIDEDVWQEIETHINAQQKERTQFRELLVLVYDLNDD